MSREFEWRNYKFEIERKPNGVAVRSDGFQATLGQLTVLSLIARGLTYKDIALKMGIARDTVRSHLEKSRRLNAIDSEQRDTLSLVIEAEKRGLLFPLTLVGIESVARSMPYERNRPEKVPFRTENNLFSIDVLRRKTKNELTVHGDDIDITFSQLKILALVSQNHSQREVASLLGISLQMLKNHLYDARKRNTSYWEKKPTTIQILSRAMSQGLLNEDAFSRLTSLSER